MIGLAVTKTEMFEKVVTVKEYFIPVIHFIDEIKRITHVKFHAKFLILWEVEHFEDYCDDSIF